MDQTMLSRWLKLVAIVVGAALAVFFALLMPWLTLVLRHSSYIGYTPPTAAHGIALLAAVDLTAIPCGGALLRFWRIADNIGRDRSFCRENVRHLLAISRYALVCVGWCLVVTAAFTVMGGAVFDAGGRSSGRCGGRAGAFDRKGRPHQRRK